MTSTAFTIAPVEKTGNALPVLAYIDNPNRHPGIKDNGPDK